MTTTTTTSKRTRKREPSVRPMVRIKKLQIENYKAIDSLEVEFPLPTLSGDPDVTVIGRKNGVGKTSVLEAASLVIMGLAGCLSKPLGRGPREFVTPDLDLVVRSSAIQAEITGTVEIDGAEVALTVVLGPSSHIECQTSGFQLPHPVFGDLYEPDDDPSLLPMLAEVSGS